MSELSSIILKVKEIKMIGGTLTAEKSVINGLKGNSVTQQEVEKFIAKGKTSYEKISTEIERAKKIQNRQKFCFDKLDELSIFMEKNDCGEMWDEDGKWCVYKY